MRVLESTELITLELKTRVPEKYLVVDRETGDVWRWCAAWKACEYPSTVTVDHENQTITVRTTIVQRVRPYSNPPVGVSLP